MRRNKNQSGFTLVELLICIGIIAVLLAVAFPAYNAALRHAHSSACSTRMRSLGVAFITYAADNDAQLPARTNGAADKWPTLLLPYIQDPKCYVDPGDPVATQVPVSDLISNSANHSSFFFNGFSDLGFYTNPNLTIRLSNLTNASNLILLGQKVNGNVQFYMDFVEGNENDVLNKQAYFGGSNYVFADGSARFISLSDYNDRMWLVNESYVIPTVPGH